MKTLAEILVGYRDDLELASRWWHRLLMVFAFTIPTVTFAISSWNTRNNYAPRDLTDINTVRLENLYNFTQAFQYGGDPAVAFAAAPGNVATVQGDGSSLDNLEAWLAFERNGVTCARGGLVYLDDAGNPRTELAVSGKVFRPLPNHKNDTSPSVCWAANDLIHVPTDQIITYRYTYPTLAVAWTKTFIMFLVEVALSLLAIWNLYYRAIIYVAFGKPTSAPPAAP